MFYFRKQEDTFLLSANRPIVPAVQRQPRFWLTWLQTHLWPTLPCLGSRMFHLTPSMLSVWTKRRARSTLQRSRRTVCNEHHVKWTKILSMKFFSVAFPRNLMNCAINFFVLVYFRGDNQDDRGNCKFKGQRCDLFSVQGWPWLQHCDDITGTSRDLLCSTKQWENHISQR